MTDQKLISGAMKIVDFMALCQEMIELDRQYHQSSRKEDYQKALGAG